MVAAAQVAENHVDEWVYSQYSLAVAEGLGFKDIISHGTSLKWS